jgi:hypothetical protein
MTIGTRTSLTCVLQESLKTAATNAAAGYEAENPSEHWTFNSRLFPDSTIASTGDDGSHGIGAQRRANFVRTIGFLQSVS